VNQLRKKIEDDPSVPVYILTDIYVGYRFVDAQTLQDSAADLAIQPKMHETDANPAHTH
jgi:two-component system KDP operon response regulator KdpE